MYFHHWKSQKIRTCRATSVILYALHCGIIVKNQSRNKLTWAFPLYCQLRILVWHSLRLCDKEEDCRRLHLSDDDLPFGFHNYFDLSEIKIFTRILLVQEFNSDKLMNELPQTCLKNIGKNVIRCLLIPFTEKT